MLRLKMRIAVFATALTFLGLLAALTAYAQPTSKAVQLAPELITVRDALEKYQDPIVAVHDGYFSTVACIEYPAAGMLADMPYPAGGMGVHFLNTSFIGPKVDPRHPQVLIYEPVADKLRLVAAEWFVPLATGIKERPQFFGQPFYGPMEGHVPIMPRELVHYDLHVWLFKSNPAGLYSPTNADVKCPKTGYSYQEATPKMPGHHL